MKKSNLQKSEKQGKPVCDSKKITELSRPLMEYLADIHNPYFEVTVSYDQVKVKEQVALSTVPDYIRD